MFLNEDVAEGVKGPANMVVSTEEGNDTRERSYPQK